MKKLLLVLITVIAIFSCSDDSGTSGGNKIRMTLDGQEIIFSNIVVDEETYPAEGDVPSYTEVTVTATANGNVLSFFVIEGETGADTLFGLQYIEDEILNTANNIISMTEMNHDNHIKGTFSGTLVNINDSGTTESVITNGSFDIEY